MLSSRFDDAGSKWSISHRNNETPRKHNASYSLDWNLSSGGRFVKEKFTKIYHKPINVIELFKYVDSLLGKNEEGLVE